VKAGIEQNPGCKVTLSFETLVKIESNEVNLSWAFNKEGSIQYQGNELVFANVGRLFGL
jgi:hypothetical protein